jgi:hypothetical protein
LVRIHFIITLLYSRFENHINCVLVCTEPKDLVHERVIAAVLTRGVPWFGLNAQEDHVKDGEASRSLSTFDVTMMLVPENPHGIVLFSISYPAV